MLKLVLKPGFNPDEILEILGDQVLFSSEDEKGKTEIVIHADGFFDFPFVERVEPYEFLDINWQEQWELFGPGFKDGVLEVQVQDKSIKMLPGPGFGNLSHPTTRLTLDKMASYCAKKKVLDIGTGSGILALAAKKLGAEKVYALEIDPLALKHAKENALLNELEVEFEWHNEKVDLVLLNMIASEQKVALKGVELKGALLISSGILEEEKSDYLEYAKSLGWEWIEENQLDGWMCFLFKVK